MTDHFVIYIFLIVIAEALLLLVAWMAVLSRTFHAKNAAIDADLSDIEDSLREHSSRLTNQKITVSGTENTFYSVADVKAAFSAAGIPIATQIMSGRDDQDGEDDVVYSTGR